jgi:hypothetical protein
MVTDLLGALVRKNGVIGRVRLVVCAALTVRIHVQVDGQIEEWDLVGAEVLEDADEVIQ